MLDIKKIIDENEVLLRGKKALYVRSSVDNTRLLVIMSTHNQGSNYLALRTFLENQFCDLLFISDPNNSWYLDDDYGETYYENIKEFSKNYDPESVFIFGSSMSGYGALLHGLRLNANVIAINPQINLDVTLRYSWSELKEHILNIEGRHINIDEHAFNLWRESVVMVLHGHYEMDVINVNLLAASTPANKKMILQTFDVDSHAYPFGRDVEYIRNIIDLISSYRNFPSVKKFENELNTSEFQVLRSRRHANGKICAKHPLHNIDSKKLWQTRHSFEQSGNLVFFSNVGYLKDGKPIGALCLYDGDNWRYLSPISDESNYLISSKKLEIDDNFFDCVNLQKISNNWIVRKDDASSISLKGSSGGFEINFRAGSTGLAFLHYSVKLKPENVSKIVGKMVTFSADVYSDNGGVMLVVGGYGDNGYHHTNSSPSSMGRWSSVSASLIFSSVQNNHHDAIFVRINFGADKKDKNVLVRNIKIVFGYFPDDLIF